MVDFIVTLFSFHFYLPMLFVFHGSDTQSARTKTRALVDDLTAKKPDASVVSLDVESFSADRIPELLYGQGLFSQKYLVVLDGVLEDAANKTAVLEALPDIATSENVFVMREGKLDAATKKLLERHAKKVTVCNQKGTAGKPPMPITFQVADALGARDKKQLWAKYQEALVAGHVAEEIHGVLFWQIKSVLLASATSSAAEAGMKDFPYQKAKRYAQKYSSEEMRAIANDLVVMYHEARQGKGELGAMLERWILGK